MNAARRFVPSRTARLDHQRRAMRRFYLLTGASTVVPGAGLIGTRLRRVGIALVSLSLLALVVLVVKLGSSGLLTTALDLGVSRGKMLALIVLMTVGMLIWCGAILLTALTSRPGELSRVQDTKVKLFAGLCCLLVVLPTVATARALTIQRSLVDTVFGPVIGGIDAVTPDQDEEDPWAAIPRVNVLLLGSDAGVDRIGVRTDSMMVASIDTRTGDSVLFGIPRNLEKVPIPRSNPLSTLYPNGYDCGDACLMNGIWTLATDNADLFPGNPNPGLSSTRDVIGAVLGLTVNHTVVIDLKGFQQLVNAMGGVDIEVKERVCVGCKGDSYGNVIWSDPARQEWIEPGQRHLDGRLALWYARSRAASDDFSRMRRQRCVVGALVSQVNPVTMLARYASLAKAIKDNVSIDIPGDDLGPWVDLVQRMQDGSMRSLPITNKVVDVGNPDYDKIHALVARALKPSPATATTTAAPSPTRSTPPPKGSTGTPTTEPNDSLSTLAAAC